MNKFMRIMVFFDLPVKTKTQRREATRFRNFLLMDGYHIILHLLRKSNDSHEKFKKDLQSGFVISNRK